MDLFKHLSDRPILEALTAKLGVALAPYRNDEGKTLQRVRYDDRGHLILLDLSGLELTQLPPEIGQLRNLTWLYVDNNLLTQLPATIGQLSNLGELDVEGNQLTELPPEIGQLSNLRKLNLNGNPLQTPPPEIVQQGTEAVLAYLRGLQ